MLSSGASSRDKPIEIYCRSGEEHSHKSPTPGGGPDEYHRAVSLFSFILRTHLAYDVSTNLELAS